MERNKDNEQEKEKEKKREGISGWIATCGLIEERDAVFRDPLSFCARRWRDKGSTRKRHQVDFQENARIQFAVTRKTGRYYFHVWFRTTISATFN